MNWDDFVRQSGKLKVVNHELHYLADLHIHSYLSIDSGAYLEKIFEMAARRGLACLAITDHDNVGAYPRACILAEGYQIQLLTGAEVTTYARTSRKPFVHLAHVLAINVPYDPLVSYLRHFPYPVRPSLSAFLDFVNGYPEALVIAAHPQPGFGMTSLSFGEIEKYRDLIHAVEVGNATEMLDKSNTMNEAARLLAGKRIGLARRLSLPMVGNSDAHKAELVGRMATRVTLSEGEVLSIPDLIKAGKCKPVLEGKKIL